MKTKAEKEMADRKAAAKALISEAQENYEEHKNDAPPGDLMATMAPSPPPRPNPTSRGSGSDDIHPPHTGHPSVTTEGHNGKPFTLDD